MKAKRELLIYGAYIIVFFQFTINLIALIFSFSSDNDPSIKAFGSLFGLIKVVVLINTSLWLAGVAIMLFRIQWLRKAVIIISVITFFSSQSIDFLTARWAISLSDVSLSFIQYLKVEFTTIGIYLQVFWIIFIWLYLFKVKTVNEYFRNKENIEK